MIKKILQFKYPFYNIGKIIVYYLSKTFFNWIFSDSNEVITPETTTSMPITTTLPSTTFSSLISTEAEFTIETETWTTDKTESTTPKIPETSTQQQQETTTPEDTEVTILSAVPASTVPTTSIQNPAMEEGEFFFLFGNK